MTRHAPFALAQTDADHRVLHANLVFSTWADLPPGGAVGGIIHEVLGVNRGDYEAALAALRQTHSVVLMREDRPGPSRVVMSVTDIDDGHRVVGFTDAAREQPAGDHAPSSEASALERGRLDVLLRAAVSFSNAYTDEQLSELLVDVLKSVLGADNASVHLHRDGKFVSLSGHNPLVDHWPSAMPPPGTHTMRAGRVQTFQSPDAARDLLPGVGMDAAMSAAGVGAVIVAPIVDQGTSFGAVGCYFSVSRQFDDYAEQLVVAIAQQAAAVFARLRIERELRRVAMLDEVTRLPNRRLFETQLEQTKEWSAGRVALVFIDLDGFKQVNDRFGHATGDRLLAQVADRLRHIQDAHDAICRFGGDEFLAYIDTADDTTARLAAERIRALLGEPYPTLPEPVPITASVGVAFASRDGSTTVDQVIREADLAMYRAKKAGGNRVCIRPA
jgi:diguanylate cyclase (GGDEF)-like protein